MLSAILDALQSPCQLGIQDAGPITTESDVAQCAAASVANSGLPMSTATAPELVSAVQCLVDVMPTKDELAALQAADPETKALLEWIRKGRSKKDAEDLPSKWRREAKCSPPFSMLCSPLANSAYRMQGPSRRRVM